jgi:accessory gene regulator protein AgrB
MKKKKNLNSIIRAYKTKNLLLSLLHLLVVLIVAFISDKLIEFLIFMLTYTFIRDEFKKAIHGSDFTDSATQSIKLCRIITTCVQLISIIFLIKVDISKYINILTGVILGIINFLAKDYLEHKVKKIKFYKGMLAEDIPDDLVGIEYEIIYQYYVKRYKLDKIGYNLNYSSDNIYKIKAKILKRYS